MPSTEQPAEPNLLQQKKPNTYWGFGLIGLGFMCELVFYSTTESVLLLPMPNESLDVLQLGMILCAMGSVYYGKIQGHKWWPQVVWSMFAMIPILGPIGLSMAILREEGAKKQVGTGLPVLGMIVLFFVVMALPNQPAVQRGYAQQEAKGVLREIHKRATAMHVDRKSFAMSDSRQLGIFETALIRTPRRASFWYFANDIPTAILGSSQEKEGCDLTAPPSSVVVVASATGFVAAAKVRMLRGDTCDEWSVNEAGELRHTLDGAKGAGPSD